MYWDRPHTAAVAKWCQCMIPNNATEVLLTGFNIGLNIIANTPDWILFPQRTPTRLQVVFPFPNRTICLRLPKAIVPLKFYACSQHKLKEKLVQRRGEQLGSVSDDEADGSGYISQIGISQISERSLVWEKCKRHPTPTQQKPLSYRRYIKSSTLPEVKRVV